MQFRILSYVFRCYLGLFEVIVMRFHRNYVTQINYPEKNSGHGAL